MSSLVNILSGGNYRSDEIPLINGVLYNAVKPLVVSHAFECMVISYCGMVAATAGCFSCAVDGELNGKFSLTYNTLINFKWDAAASLTRLAIAAPSRS